MQSHLMQQGTGVINPFNKSLKLTPFAPSSRMAQLSSPVSRANLEGLLVNELLKWAGQYSAPVVILLACGAALIFVFRYVVEKAVEAEFDKRTKRIELLLERRSNFEEKVLLDQYEAVTALQLKLGNVGADLNRMRNGIEVEGLMNGKDIVPLSDIYVELQAKRFLLKEEFYNLLQKRADNLRAFANARNADEVSRLGREFLSMNQQFREKMNRAFGIEKISWTALGTVEE